MQTEMQGQDAGGGGGAASAAKKIGGDLPRGRGGINQLGDSKNINALIAGALGAGARCKPAGEEAGIDLRTLQRWKAEEGPSDRRPVSAR